MPDERSITKPEPTSPSPLWPEGRRTLRRSRIALAPKDAQLREALEQLLEAQPPTDLDRSPEWGRARRHAREILDAL